MATQKTQDDDKIDRMSVIGIAVSFLIVYGAISSAVGTYFTLYTHSLIIGNVISFAAIGIGSYFLLHLLIFKEMASLDSRLLHELAKRNLIEFQEMSSN